MNAYTELLRYFYTIGKPLVNTMTQGQPSDVDLEKKNIFPLIHVEIGSATFPSPGTIRFNVKLSCMDIRDITKEVKTDKYYSNDNEVDNLNATLAALNRIWQDMWRDFGGSNIVVSEVPGLVPFVEEKDNILDGWIMDFDVTLPNVMIDLCQ